MIPMLCVTRRAATSVWGLVTTMAGTQHSCGARGLFQGGQGETVTLIGVAQKQMCSH